MFRLHQDVTDAPAQLARLFRMQGGEIADGYIVRDELPSDVSLAYDRHKPSLLARKADLSRFGSVSQLDHLFEVRLGLNLALTRGTSSGTIPVLKGRDIRRDGTIAFSDATERIAVPEEQCLRSGDLVIRAISRPTDDGAIPVAEITDADLPLVAASTVVVLRPQPGVSGPQRRLAWYFLRSQLFKSLAHALGRGGPRLDIEAIRKMHVPQPDDALVEALEQLAAAGATFQSWYSEVDDVLEGAFDAEDARLAREKIVESGRTCRMRAEAGSLVNDLYYTARTRMPLPVAYHWRIAEAELSNGPTSGAYVALLDAFETLMCYAALVGVLMARLSGVQISALAQVRDKLASGRTGPGLGEWTDILQEVQGRRFRTLSEASPFADLRGLFGDEEAEAARRRLTGRRNDESHQRRVEPRDLPEAVQSTKNDVGLLLSLDPRASSSSGAP